MWNFRKNNLLVNDKDKLFVHKVHLENLLHARSYINNKGRETPYFIKYKLSKRKSLRDIERNILLLKKKKKEKLVDKIYLYFVD